MSTPSQRELELEAANEDLRAQLYEAQETLRAIQAGEVDALVMGEDVYTLKGAETPYRFLIEQMYEGAGTLSDDSTVLYANRRLSELLKAPLPELIGNSLRRFVAPNELPTFDKLLADGKQSSSTGELTLQRQDGSALPAQVSFSVMDEQDSHPVCVTVTDLHERKRAEQALQRAHDSLEQRVADRTAALEQQRAWLSVTLGSIGDALIATDAAGRISFLNPVAETLTGWSQPEALGQPVQSVFRILDELTRRPGEDIVGRVLREGLTAKLANHTCLLARSGREIPIEDSAAPIKDRDGKVAGAVLVFHDVTDQRRALRALRESEERFRVAQELSPDGFTIFRPVRDERERVVDFTWIYENPAIAHLNGTDPKAVIGRRLLEVFPSHRGSAFSQAYQHVAETGEPRILEAPYQGDSIASRTWFRVAVVRMGQDVAVLSQNITARKQAEEVLQNTLQRFYLMLASMYSGVLLMTQDGRIELVNQAFCDAYALKETPAELVGLPSQELLEKILPAFAHPDEARARLGEMLHRGQPVRLEEFAMQGGRTALRDFIPLSIQGKPCGRLWIYTDISERKRAEEALRHTAEELKRSNRDLEQFAYVASHDLQEPLRAVGGYAQLLQRRLGDKLDGKNLEYLTGAVEGTQRMKQLINDMLAVARISTGERARTLTNLNEVLRRARRNLDAAFKRTRAKLTSKGLPTLAVDAAQITQLFQNLLANAIKFCRANPPKIDVRAMQEPGRWVVSVRDNGIGIPPESSERVFQIFQRLHARHQYPGTGIGLAICKRIVECHGGAIWVESHPGQGSTFYFSIPEAVTNEPSSAKHRPPQGRSL